MKKYVITVLASMALFACGQNSNSAGGDGATDAGAAGVTPAPGAGGGDETNSEGEPNVVDSAAQDTTHDASLKPAPKNEVTPPEVTKPKR